MKFKVLPSELTQHNTKMGFPINDSIPRVPEPHAEISVEDEKLLSDLYIRTSWFDAALALDQIEKVSLPRSVLSVCREGMQFFWVFVECAIPGNGCNKNELRTRHGEVLGWLYDPFTTSP